MIALNCDSVKPAIFAAFTRVIGVSAPDAMSIRLTSPGVVGVLTTATPRRPSADTDSTRPDHSPAATGATAPLATFSR